MAVIRIKRRAAGGNAGAPAALAAAELAFNEQDNILYYGKGDSGGAATSIISIAGANKADLASPTFTGTPAAPTAAADTNTTQLATTAFVIGQAASAAPGMNGTAAVGTSLKYARADHVHPTDTSRAALASPTFTGTPAAPTAAADTNTTQLATTAFVVGQASSSTPGADSGSGAVGTSLKFARADHVHPLLRLDQAAAPTAAVAMNSQKITGLADPTAAQDAATKAYVDAAIQGLDPKPSVVAATTANITLSAAQTIDGISVVAGDRVLVKNQTLPQENGIYVVAAGAWSRATDMDAWAEVPGAFVFVERGTTNSDTGWLSSADAGGTLGTTALPWVQFSSAGSVTAQSPLSMNGNQVQLTGTVAVGNGGTGATSLTGILKGNGTSAFTAATAGTDYLAPSSTVDGGTF